LHGWVRSLAFSAQPSAHVPATPEGLLTHTRCFFALLHGTRTAGLGDESDCEENEPAQYTSRHGNSTNSNHSTSQYSGQGSILASWGMLGAPSAAAPMQAMYAEDEDDSTSSTPDSQSDCSMAASPTGCTGAGFAADAVAAAESMSAGAATAGTPFAAADAWQSTSDTRVLGSLPPVMGCRQGSAVSTCSSERMLADH
jgi:hypothetical protein